MTDNKIAIMRKLTFIVLMQIVCPLAGSPKQKFGCNHYVGSYKQDV